VSDVKQSLALSLTAVVLLTVGCSDLQLARFAPPGIVKYEDIASEKPPNPAIQQMIEERREDREKEFPILAETPSKKDRPQKRSAAENDAVIASLEEARNTLNESIEASRARAKTELAESVPLPERRDALTNQIEQDEAFAKKERKGRKPEKISKPTPDEN
jgi:hypothetical protein